MRKTVKENRYFTLVQIISQPGLSERLEKLCNLWGVKARRSSGVIDQIATLQALAYDVIEYEGLKEGGLDE